MGSTRAADTPPSSVPTRELSQCRAALNFSDQPVCLFYGRAVPQMRLTGNVGGGRPYFGMSIHDGSKLPADVVAVDTIVSEHVEPHSRKMDGVGRAHEFKSNHFPWRLSSTRPCHTPDSPLKEPAVR